MPNQYIDLLEDYFLKNENKEDAYFMKKYLKDKFEFYGIKTEKRRQIYKDVINELGVPKKKDLNILIKELWEEPQREYHHFGMELCEKYKKEIDESFLDLYEFMLTHKSWWDTVDYIAIKLVGHYFTKYPDLINPTSEKYIASNNIWLNRTAILFQLKYKENTDEELLYHTITCFKNSKEFFILKAIGWALREYSKTYPKKVLNFVQNNQLASLSKREALRIINK